MQAKTSGVLLGKTGLPPRVLLPCLWPCKSVQAFCRSFRLTNLAQAFLLLVSALERHFSVPSPALSFATMLAVVQHAGEQRHRPEALHGERLMQWHAREKADLWLLGARGRGTKRLPNRYRFSCGMMKMFWNERVVVVVEHGECTICP